MVALILALAPLDPLHAQGGSAAPQFFDRSRLIEIATELRDKPYQPPPEVPETFSNLGYDAYRDFRFRPERRLWRGDGLGFEVDFMHAGFLYKQPVEVFEVVGGVARRIEYDPGMFVLGPAIPEVPPDAPGMFSGVRLYAPVESASRLDEFLVFQGASYFRARGAGQDYGLSARGLAVDTGRTAPESFPQFRSFWLERPAPGAKSMTVHALLDGRDAVGAFTFEIWTGSETRMHVEALVIPRRDIEAVGIAPLTSMYLFGPANRHRFNDFRSAVHDSDGLLIRQADGAWAWRALRNPLSLTISRFPADSPKGFGLLQRQRDLDQYHDWEARYHNRPSAWVEPVGDWGAGSIELVEIQTQREYADNIVAFWRPERPAVEGEPLKYDYRLFWGAPKAGTRLSTVTATRAGLTMTERQLFVVEFAPPGKQQMALHNEALSSEINPPVEIDLSASRGRIRYPVVEWNAAAGRYRVSFQLDTEGVEDSDLRLVLRRGGKAVSETWLYRWTRN